MKIENDKKGFVITTGFIEIILFVGFHIFYLLLTGLILTMDLISIFTPVAVDILSYILVFAGFIVGLFMIAITSHFMLKDYKNRKVKI